jgi:hypothetical protein
MCPLETFPDITDLQQEDKKKEEHQLAKSVRDR